MKKKHVLVQRLLQKSHDGKLVWEPIEDLGFYTDIDIYRVMVCASDGTYFLYIHNLLLNRFVDSVRCGCQQRFLKGLYNVARKCHMSRKVAINKIIKNLEEMK